MYKINFFPPINLLYVNLLDKKKKTEGKKETFSSPTDDITFGGFPGKILPIAFTVCEFRLALSLSVWEAGPADRK